MIPSSSSPTWGDKRIAHPRGFSFVAPSPWFTRIAAGATLLLAAYWAVFALVTPVTVWDSYTYNLARLMLAEHGGIFADGIWNTPRQVIFPWSFDAIHYPYLRLLHGFGVAIPSFLCLIGTLVVVWRTVRSRYSAEVAWLACLALFALPTVIFQATSTKNDIPLVFGAACWFYAFWQWRQTGAGVHLAWAAIALGFIAGTKTTGVPVAVVLCMFTIIYLLRKSRHTLRFFIGAAVAAAILLGSVETYVNNVRVYGAPLGDASLIQDHRNRDGIRGTAANLLRYTIGNLDVGYDFDTPQSPIPDALERACRNILTFLKLENVGYRSDFNDENLEFLKSGWEAASSYGPLGALALLCSLVIFVVVDPRDPAWRLVVCGWAELLIISATTAWMPWNARFLLIPFVCFVIALILALASSLRFWRPARWGLLALAIFSAIAYPSTSFNKKPTDLWRAAFAREDAMFAERSGESEIFRDLHDRNEQLRDSGLAIVADGDSWILQYYIQRSFPVFPLPQPTRALLTELADRHGGRVYVLGLSRDDLALPELGLTLLRRYAGTYPGTYSALYLFISASAASDPTTLDPLNMTLGSGPSTNDLHENKFSFGKGAVPEIVWLKGHYSDNWTAEDFEFTINNQQEVTLTIDLWNPTPLDRKFIIKSSVDTISGEILSGSKVLVNLKTAAHDIIENHVSPAFIPRQHDAGPDDRSLGLLHIQIQLLQNAH